LNVTLEPRSVFASMATNQTLPGFPINPTKNFSAVLSWTSTPTGTISLEVSNDSTDGVNGIWVSYTDVTLGTQPAGGVGKFGVSLADLAYRWIRVVYTAGSGSGTLTVTANGKG
jgi:hypothetical protein